MEAIQQLSTFGFLMTPAGLLLIVMAIAMIVLVSFFVPGGMKKFISIALIVLTFGIGVVVLKNRKNKLVQTYNDDLKKYQDLLAQKAQNDEKVQRLRDENEDLKRREGVAAEKMDEHFANYVEAKKKTAELELEREQLGAAIDARAETLDDGYEFGTAARFRRQWEAAKVSAHRELETPAETDTAVPAAPAVAAALIADPKPITASVTIDISEGPYRLKGDVE